MKDVSPIGKGAALRGDDDRSGPGGPDDKPNQPSSRTEEVFGDPSSQLR